MKKSFKVLNVKCGGCANTLKNALKDEFGEVEVNLEVMPREITLDVSDDNIEHLRKKLKSIGYPMVDENMGFFEEKTIKAKSFVSCAIGKIS